MRVRAGVRARELGQLTEGEVLDLDDGVGCAVEDVAEEGDGQCLAQLFIDAELAEEGRERRHGLAVLEVHRVEVVDWEVEVGRLDGDHLS